MAVRHAAVKAPGERGTSAEWNAGHILDEGSGLGAACTLVVAASDSFDKSVADYVCDGVNDEVEINQALNALPGFGGSVVLLEGTFYLGAAIVNTKEGVRLSGQGKSTVITTSVNGITLITSNDWSYFQAGGFTLKGPAFPTTASGIIVTGGTYCLFRDIWAYGRLAYLIRFDLVGLCKIENIFEGFIDFSLISINDSSYNIISNCHSDGIEIRISNDSNRNLIKGNMVQKIRIQHAACDDNVVHGNLMDEWVDGGTNTMDWDNYVF